MISKLIQARQSQDPHSSSFEGSRAQVGLWSDQEIPLNVFKEADLAEQSLESGKNSSIVFFKCILNMLVYLALPDPGFFCQ